MTLDELFNEYKRKKEGADKLLNLVAEEARRFCMAAVYRGRKQSFYRKIPQDEALSIFDETFMKCVRRGLEGKTETLSGCLCFYFANGMIDHIRHEWRAPVPLSEVARDPGTSTDDFIDALKAKNKGRAWLDPASGIRAREIMNCYLNLLEDVPRFRRDALILNFGGLSPEDIAHFLDARKEKVSKEKFNGREKLREILHQKE